MGLGLWLDFATHKLCLGRFGFDRRVNFITDLGIKSLLNGMLKNVNNFINTKCWFLFLHSLSFNWSTMHTLLNGMLKVLTILL